MSVPGSTVGSVTTTIAPGLAADVEWRRLGRFLWTGRRDGRPVGMIEQGRWFALTDADGEPAGRYRSLADAQAAMDPARRAALDVGGVRMAVVPRLVALSVAAGGGLLLGSTALAVLRPA